MDLQGYLSQRNINKYHLSKISGLPKTTIMDICAGTAITAICKQISIMQKSMEG